MSLQLTNCVERVTPKLTGQNGKRARHEQDRKTRKKAGGWGKGRRKTEGEEVQFVRFNNDEE